VHSAGGCLITNQITRQTGDSPRYRRHIHPGARSGTWSRSLVPEEIADHPDLTVQSVPEASALTDHDIDYEAVEDLPDDLKSILIEHGYYAADVF